jgi:uncharacterized repeat protein (TIGR01451 family)
VIRCLTQTQAVSRSRRLALLAGALCLAAFLLAGPAQASADVAWRITSVSNTTVAPGAQLTYHLEIANVGDANTDGSNVKLTATLPAGMTGVSADTTPFTENSQSFECPGAAGASVITCEGTPFFPAGGNGFNTLTITVEVASDAPEALTTAFELEGGGAPEAAHTVDPVTVTTALPAFGLDAFDLAATTDGAAFTQAGGHPDAQATSIDFNTHTDPNPAVGDVSPLEDTRDVTVDLPPGLVGDPASLAQCTLAQLAVGGLSPAPECPLGSQLGTALVRHSVGGLGPVSVFNMVPPPGAPARFAYDVSGTIVVLDAHVRSSGDYGISTSAAYVPQGLSIVGNDIDFWGVPADPAHKPERACPGQEAPAAGGETCAATTLPAAFFRTPTSCTAPGEGLPVSARMDSWQHPGVFKEKSIRTHQPLGYPYPEEDWGPEAGIEGCDQVPFQPTLSAALTTDRADSPTGLSVDIGLPSDCWDPKATAAEVEESICQSDIRETSVTLPPGLSLTPAAAGGRASCTPAQIGLTTGVDSSPIHFDEAPAACPDAAKVGTVEIETPLLGRHDSEGKPVSDEAGNPVLEPLTGSVYLAQQSQNPFGSLLAIYLVAEGSGVIVKQAGEISLSDTGQVTTSFDQVPQTPVSEIKVDLFGGQRAALRTPAACGSFTATGTLTPWSGNAPAPVSSSFQVTQGCGGGFDPRLQAGTENPLAGSYSPFHLRLSREDASQELAGLSATLAPGLIGKPAGIPYCPEATLAAISGEPGSGAAQEAAPSCPAASRLGTVTVGAGAGADPFYTSAGRAYLAGPYKGAPLSLAVVAPAVAGPFDLGSVVVRNAVRVDPETTQLTAVSDPLPTILHGIPLDLRDIRVDLDRPNFTLNPTGCEPAAITSRVTSAQGAVATPSSHFQAAGCDRLAFEPRLALRLKGATRRSGHPALTAVLRPRLGNANAARVQVALPHSEFLAQNHIKTICTRVQFAAGSGGGEGCPAGSVYGTVTATSPLLDYPLAGNVYLRSSDHPLPDMVLALRGPASQPLEVDAVGRIDSHKGGIRTTFAQVPDAPLTKVVLRLPGGRKSLLENSTDLCRAADRASVRMTGHNGKTAGFSAPLRVRCGKGKNRHKGSKRAG